MLAISSHKPKTKFIKTASSALILHTHRNSSCNDQTIYCKRNESQCSVNTNKSKSKYLKQMIGQRKSIENRSERNIIMNKDRKIISYKPEKYCEVLHWKSETNKKKSKTKKSKNNQSTTGQRKGACSVSPKKDSIFQNQRNSLCASTICSKFDESQQLASKFLVKSTNTNELKQILQKTASLLSNYQIECQKLMKQKEKYKTKYKETAKKLKTLEQKMI